ncbi:MAG: glutamyl-tRNA amidotransferase subunit A [marine bacterium B5-7]|nr:MAG: glutamyl-tRNA amidotransferase subunit A [marine bacterium B5-7]
MIERTETGTPTVRQCVELITSGALTSEHLLESYLDVIDATDAQIHAWAHIDRDHALEQARHLDDIRRRGLPVGNLHGIPVGIKDIFDTVEYVTERGSNIYANRNPSADSAVVERLKEAGAVIIGKSVTTELAWINPAATRNPHDHSRTPGGSSSGSAAAVAAGHVPLSIGSQTGGSVIRPASFCGVYGFKPSRGIISRRGVYQTSPTLDQVGVFGRDLGDVSLLVDVLGAYDANDSASYLAPRPHMLEGFLSDVLIEPNFVWIDMPYEEHYSKAVSHGCNELMEAIGGQLDRVPAPKSFIALIECHKIIYEYEIYRCLTDERENHWGLLSDTARRKLEVAGKVSDDQYQDALDVLNAANQWFEQFFYDYDSIVTPSSLGEAPAFEEGTGDPICCTIWTLCGLPCISLPLLLSGNGMPIGLQIVGGINRDDDLLRTSRWLLNTLRNDDMVEN